jgi:hypothetical protein
LPLVKNYQELQNLEIDIENRGVNIYSLIVEKIKHMRNYQEALENFKYRISSSKYIHSKTLNAQKGTYFVFVYLLHKTFPLFFVNVVLMEFGRLIKCFGGEIFYFQLRSKETVFQQY